MTVVKRQQLVTVGTGLWSTLGSVALALVFSASVSGQRFLPEDTLPYGIHDVGGCKIISIRKAEGPSPSLREWCRNVPVVPQQSEVSWHDYYSSIELMLGDGVVAAEKHLGGYRYSILDRNAQLVLYPGAFPNAMISAAPSEIVISINDGLIQMVESTVSGIRMEEAAQGTGFFAGTVGVTFSDWLEIMRTPRWGEPRRQPIVGPESAVGRSALAGAWYSQTRREATALYAFLCAHELAHLVAGDRAPSGNLELEKERDLAALQAMARVEINGYLDFSTILVTSWMLAMSYHERYWEVEIERLGYWGFGESSPPSHPRNWKSRGKALLDYWIGVNSGIPMATKREVHQAILDLYALRDPITEDGAMHELRVGLEIAERDMNGDGPGMRQRAYSFALTNRNRVAVQVHFEVQSRIYPRNEDVAHSKWAPYDELEGRPYKIVDDSEHKVVLAAGETHVVSGTVRRVDGPQLYGKLGPRVVSVSRLEGGP